LSFLASDVGFKLLVVFPFTVEFFLVIFEISLLFVQEILGASILFAGFVDQFISFARVFNSILPLEVQLVAFTM